MDESAIKPSKAIPQRINKWLCHKLECFSEFFEVYSGKNLKYCLELFAGCGACTCRESNCLVDGSELRAMQSGFSRCIFIARDSLDFKNLKMLIKPIKAEGCVIHGNCISESVIQKAFDLIPRSASSLAVIDPPGYNRLRWSSIRKLVDHGIDWKGNKIDQLIIFPLEMALLRNLTRPDCEASINRLYGNRDWQQVRQQKIDGSIGQEKARKQLIALFNAGLKKLGYRYVEDLVPAPFSNPPNYHIIWASDSGSRLEQLSQIWHKPRYLHCEMFGNSGIKK
ncbi:three-Cys-motif partner protein TcmP [Chloroflexota bacterium]